MFGGESDYDILHSVDEVVAAEGPLIVVGVLIDVEHGRKAYSGEGCIVTHPEDERSPCQGDGTELLYNSYVNLVIQPEQFVRGSLAVPEADLHVELPWPNNLEIDELVASSPVGGRVLVLGEPVRNAREEAKPLVEAGLAAADSVADNLTQTGPYGLAFEDADGFVASAFGGENLALVLDASGAAVRFDDLVAAIESAAAE